MSPVVVAGLAALSPLVMAGLVVLVAVVVCIRRSHASTRPGLSDADEAPTSPRRPVPIDLRLRRG